MKQKFLLPILTKVLKKNQLFLVQRIHIFTVQSVCPCWMHIFFIFFLLSVTSSRVRRRPRPVRRSSLLPLSNILTSICQPCFFYFSASPNLCEVCTHDLTAELRYYFGEDYFVGKDGKPLKYPSPLLSFSIIFFHLSHPTNTRLLIQEFQKSRIKKS